MRRKVYCRVKLMMLRVIDTRADGWAGSPLELRRCDRDLARRLLRSGGRVWVYVLAENDAGDFRPVGGEV